MKTVERLTLSRRRAVVYTNKTFLEELNQVGKQKKTTRFG